MAESLRLPNTTNRKAIYDALLPQLQSILEGERDVVANLANCSAVLKEALGFFWVGFYLLKEGELVLGPFQGPLACTRIALSRGVCGAAFSKGETILVPDVEKFPGHIACSSASKSEIVLVLRSARGEKVGVLDVDSDRLNDFGPVDADGLSQVVELLSRTTFI